MHSAHDCGSDGAALPHEGTARWLAALDGLAPALEGHPWLLAGGLAVPLTVGRFHRAHQDVDIVFPFAGFGGIDDAMRRAGYRLTTRVCFDLGRRITLLLPLRGRSSLLRLWARKLRFVPRRRLPAEMPAHVDVMPYEVADGCIAPRNMKRRVPLTVPLEGARATLPTGRTIGVLHLHYVRALMLRRHTASHRHDLAVIDDALGYGSLSTAGPPLISATTSDPT